MSRPVPRPGWAVDPPSCCQTPGRRHPRAVKPLLGGYLGRESEVSALNLGTYEVCGHSINEVMSAVLGSLPLNQPLKSKPVTPCWVVVLPDATGSNAEQPSGIPRYPRER